MFLSIRSALAGLCVFFVFSGFSNDPYSDMETAIIEQDYKKAESLAKGFISAHPEYPKLDAVYYYLGLSQLNLGQIPDSRETFSLLIDRFPSQPLLDKAYLGLIDACLLGEDHANALIVAEALLKASPQSEFLGLIYLKFARAHLKMAHWPQARGYLERIIADFPDGMEAHLARQLLEEKQFFSVQVGSFLDRGRAEGLIGDLKLKGEYAYIVETKDYSGKKFYRVRIGQFSGLGEAQGLQKKLADLGYPTRIYP